MYADLNSTTRSQTRPIRLLFPSFPCPPRSRWPSPKNQESALGEGWALHDLTRNPSCPFRQWPECNDVRNCTPICNIDGRAKKPISTPWYNRVRWILCTRWWYVCCSVSTALHISRSSGYFELPNENCISFETLLHELKINSHPSFHYRFPNLQLLVTKVFRLILI